MEGVGHPKLASRQMGWEIWKKSMKEALTSTCQSCWRMMMMKMKRGRRIRVEKNPQPLGPAIGAIGAYPRLDIMMSSSLLSTYRALLR